MNFRKRKLIVGLGNPGSEYDNTRHNIGFELVKVLAKQWGSELVKERTFLGFFARTATPEEDILLLQPLTYMNDSGIAVRRCLDFYKISLQDLLIVADDIELPLGTVRIRPKGRCGGHNGLRSVEDRLGTTLYSRLRIGVSAPKIGTLSDYVLGSFEPAEREMLPIVIDKGVELVKEWIKDSNLSRSIEIDRNIS